MAIPGQRGGLSRFVKLINLTATAWPILVANEKDLLNKAVEALLGSNSKISRRWLSFNHDRLAKPLCRGT